MSKNWKFVSGDWNFICDSCGQKKKASVGKLRWDGFRVCPDCFEMRHPQDFLRARVDNQSVPWSRPKADVFLPPFVDYGDFLSIAEGIITVGEFVRFIGAPTAGSNDEDVINGSVLNAFELNHSSVDLIAPINEEAVTLSEVISTVIT